MRTPETGNAAASQRDGVHPEQSQQSHKTPSKTGQVSHTSAAGHDTATVLHLTVTSIVRGDKKTVRVAKRAAGPGGSDSSQPGQLIVFGSRVDRVLAALRDAGINVNVETQR